MSAARHRRSTVPRSWWQVIVPVITLGALLCTGIVALVYGSGSPAAVSQRISGLPPYRVTETPPGKPLPRLSLAPVYYKVQRGDSWWSIAGRFCHSGAADTQLASRNHSPLSGALPLGKTIIITCS